MTTRTINGDIPLYPSSTVTFRNRDVIISGGDTYPPKTTTAAVSVSGVMASTALIVPDTGAAVYNVTLPAETDRRGVVVQVSIEAGAALDLSVLLAAGLAADADPDYVAQAVDAETAARVAADAALDTRVDALELAPPAHTHDDRYYTEAEADARFALLRHVTAQTLTDAASIAWDTSAGHLASVTLGGNRTLAAPTNGVAGTYILRVTQGSGGQTLGYDAAFKWPTGSAPVLSTTAAAVDVLSFVSIDGATFYGSALKGMS